MPQLAEFDHAVRIDKETAALITALAKLLN